MKITDALLKLKTLKERIARLYNIRRDHFKTYIPKDTHFDDIKKDPKKYNVILFDEVTERISKVEVEINGLRERLLKTNVSTTVETADGDTVTLAMLKLMVDTYRSKLSQVMDLKNHRFGYSRSRSPVTAEEEEILIEQLNDMELENLISKYESEKNALQLVLDKANARTDLVG